jgi:response regulator of citrate/malate metabolism
MKKVIIVDDDAGDRTILTRDLEKLAGITILEADSYRSGMDMIMANLDADLLVVDGNIGPDFGHELLRTVFLAGFDGNKVLAASDSADLCQKMVDSGALHSCKGKKDQVIEIVRTIIGNS